jgi:hypothetical protein
LATVAGLILGGLDFEEEEGILAGWGEKVRKMFRVFLP